MERYNLSRDRITSGSGSGRRIGAALLLLAFVAAPAAAQPGDSFGALRPADMSVSHAGRVLIEPARRMTQLKRLDASQRRRLCPAVTIDPDLPPVLRLAGSVEAIQRGTIDRSAQPFAMALMQGAAASLNGDEQAARGTIKLLDNWARANALSELVDIGAERNNFVAQYSLRRVMLAVVPSWALLYDRADAETRKRVDSWVAQRMAATEQPVGPAESRKNAHQSMMKMDYYQLMREALAMEYAVMTGSNEGFRRGVTVYLATLRQMRDDGSLPLETAHGSRALWYQRHAIASLVTMAQIASEQGYNLYDAEVDGKRLDRAINFLLSESTDPHQIASYAPENQDLGFLQRRPDGRDFMAWIEPWMAHANVGPIPDGDPLQVAISDRPLIDEIAGGNASCQMAPVR
jgi:hypothetical protein